MKQKISILTLLLVTNLTFAQKYDSLQKMGGIEQNVYYSENAKKRAVAIFNNVSKAESFFEKKFDVHPNYDLLILNPSDWKLYAHPNAIYGIPHYLPDGRLVVASENNHFWKRSIPPLDQIPPPMAEQMKKTYTDETGEVSLMSIFDLIAIHELCHSFLNSAEVNTQRNWLNELFANIMLHTYIAENNPERLPTLTVFPKVMVQTFPRERLKYTTLNDFQTKYQDIAQNHPDNYGWYQSRFHYVAGQIYDSGGAGVMEKLWTALLNQKEKLNDQELIDLLKETNPALEQAMVNWNQ